MSLKIVPTLQFRGHIYIYIYIFIKEVYAVIMLQKIYISNKLFRQTMQKMHIKHHNSFQHS